MENIFEFCIDRILETKVSFIPRGSFATIYFEELPDGWCPEDFLVKRVDKDTLEITPMDRIFKESYFDREAPSLVAEALYYTNRLKATIAVVKKYSTTEPLFNFYPDDRDFSYSFTIPGETFGEIFKKVTEMYREIDIETGTDDDYLIIEQFKNSI